MQQKCRKAFAVLENTEKSEADEEEVCMGKGDESYEGKKKKETNQPKQSKE